MIKYNLKIDGMMCGMCEAHINEAVRNNFNVKKVNSSHTKKECVIVSEDELEEEKLRKVIDDTGYKLICVSKENYEKKGLFSRFKNK